MTTMRSFFFAVFLSGCAASAISEDADGGIPLYDDNGSSDSSDTGAPAPGGSTTRDASTPATTTRDAGSPATPGRDAGALATDASTPAKDAGTTPAKDASAPSNPVVDAGSTTPPKDAGSTTPTPTKDASTPSPRDAGTTNPNAGQTCTKDSDCTQSCLPIGVASCCRGDNTCGCTWTPGVDLYCL